MSWVRTRGYGKPGDREPGTDGTYPIFSDRYTTEVTLSWREPAAGFFGRPPLPTLGEKNWGTFRLFPGFLSLGFPAYGLPLRTVAGRLYKLRNVVQSKNNQHGFAPCLCQEQSRESIT